MKKILLIPAALALSTSFAFAQVWTITSSTQSAGSSAAAASTPTTPTLNQTFSLNQTVGNTDNGGFALNKGLFVQAQVPVNAPGTTLNQSLTANQTIGNTSTGGTAINKATVIQAQVPLNFAAP